MEQSVGLERVGVWAGRQLGGDGVGRGAGRGNPSAAAQTSCSVLVTVLKLRLLLATRILKRPQPCLSSPGLPWCPWSHALKAVLFIYLLTL